LAVCRFDEFLGASVQEKTWPRDEHEACRLLQERSVDQARSAILDGTLLALHGRRFDAE
jgi:hypothetical protein